MYTYMLAVGREKYAIEMIQKKKNNDISKNARNLVGNEKP